jgi:hypothetical protein
MSFGQHAAHVDLFAQLRIIAVKLVGYRTDEARCADGMSRDGRLRACFGELFEEKFRAGLSELNRVVVVEKLLGYAHAVYVTAVGRAEVLQEEISAEADYLGVIAGDGCIGEAERILRPPPYSEARFFEYEDAAAVS